MRKLPSLNGLRAFESAARTGSFARAAGELHVSPAAVSRMVHLLEASLGVPLFERRANGLTATDAGRAYQLGLTPVFDSIAHLTAQIAAAANARVLTIGVGPTFAVRWLIPRLARFQSRHPGLEVRFATGGAAAPFADDWTCGIKLGDGRWPGLEAEMLFPANLIPVCGPRFARRLTGVEQLRPAHLLRVEHAADDWPRWLAAAGRHRIAAKGPVFQFYGQALQAAADEAGVAMGIRPYIDDDLDAGRLVAPFALSVPKDAQWYLVYRAGRRNAPHLSTFRKWLLAEIRRTRRR